MEKAMEWALKVMGGAEAALGFVLSLFSLRKYWREARPPEPKPDVHFSQRGTRSDGPVISTVVRNPSDHTMQLVAVEIETPSGAMFRMNRARMMPIGASGWIAPGRERGYDHELVGLPGWKGGEICLVFQMASKPGAEVRSHKLCLMVGT
jgi:hypothetical protein